MAQGETYAGDDRAAREARAASADDGGFIGGWHRAVAGVRADHAADVFAEGQARRLGMGVRTRSGPQLPGTYYLGYEHSDLKQMVELNMDPGQVNETGAGWNSLGNALVEFQGAVAAAVGRGGEDWSGAAGKAARDYLSGLGEWMGGTGQASQLAANRMNDQAEAAGTARAAMPEPVEFSMSDAIGVLARETNPVALRNAIAQVNLRFEQKQQAHERAAEVMTTFAGSMGDSGAGMPEFGPAPAMGASAGVEGPGGRGPDVGPERGGFRPRGGGPSDSSDPGIPEWGGRPAGSAPVAEGSPGRDAGATPVRGWEPVAATGEQVGTGGSGMRAVGRVPGSMAVDAGSSPHGAELRGSGPGGERGPGSGGESGSGARSSGGQRDGGRGPGEGRGAAEGGGTGGGRGADGRRGAGEGHGAGGGRDMGDGRGAAEGRGAGSGHGAAEGAGRGVAGGRGTGGSPGAAGGRGAGSEPMGAGQGWRGEEDREHRRPSWLEEPDPEAVFGIDEPTVPPVIGLDAS
jgi:hypothetical protein